MNMKRPKKRQITFTKNYHALNKSNNNEDKNSDKSSLQSNERNDDNNVEHNYENISISSDNDNSIQCLEQFIVDEMEEKKKNGLTTENRSNWIKHGFEDDQRKKMQRKW